MRQQDGNFLTANIVNCLVYCLVCTVSAAVFSARAGQPREHLPRFDSDQNGTAAATDAADLEHPAGTANGANVAGQSQQLEVDANFDPSAETVAADSVMPSSYQE